MKLGLLTLTALHPQVELLLTQAKELIFQLGDRLVTEFTGIHHSTERVTKMVFTESFAAASAMASRAWASVTPSIS